jgi:DivIVA domain-containing protein
MSNTVQVRRGDEMPLTPADVRNKQFSTTRLRPGYDEEEVDAFLDEVESELDRLIQENEELRAKLAECLRGGKSAVPALGSPLSEPKPDMMGPERVEPERRQPEPVMMGGMPHIEDNMDTAARVLSLAQQTADQAIADARREADETLGRARREADEVLTKARRQAEQITGDARARAESLERDAQERHRQAMGSLVQTREELERRVDDLRAFEREYRSRLKAYLEGQLRDLEAGVTDSGTFPAVGSTGPQPPMPAALGAPVGRNGGQGTGQYGVTEVVQHSGGFRTNEAAPARERR